MTTQALVPLNQVPQGYGKYFAIIPDELAKIYIKRGLMSLKTVSTMQVVGQSSKLIDPSPQTFAFWSGTAGQFVSMIKNGAGLAISGFVIGMGLVWLVDTLRDRHIKVARPTSIIKDRLPKRIQTVSDIKKVVLCGAGLGVLIGVGITGRLNIISNIGLSFLLVGTITGEKVWHNRMDSVSQCLQLINETFDTDRELDLSTHINKLRKMSLAELTILGTRIYEEFNYYRWINLKGCDLTDLDVQRLAQAGWFSKFNGINLSCNHNLTAKTLMCITQKTFSGSKNTITSINLSDINLTDDGLKCMVESEVFNRAFELILRNNPRISGQGLAYIGDHATNLGSLDIGRNPQLFKEKEVDKWIRKSGFNALRGLRVYSTGMTTKVFERLLDETEWFKKLTGLDIRHNPELCLSSRIGELKNLVPYGPDRCHISYYFRDAGLYFKGCDTGSMTAEFKKLCVERIANGVAEAMPCLETSHTKEEKLRLSERSSNE